MLVNKNTYGNSRNKKHITGRGFVDTMSSAFNSFKSYVSANKDLIAKPLSGAVGSLAATGLTAGVPALINHIANRNKNRHAPKLPDDPKYKEILKSLLTESQPSVSNIIGSGTKSRRRSGAGIKRF